MREIKFRAWNGKYKEMRIVDLLLRSGEVTCGSDAFKPEALMQYTGLKDKNGKEIYEGDIIAVKCAGGLQNFEVVWEEEYARFNRKNCPYMSGGCSSGDGTEIIGNIYENPELLK